MEFDEVVEVLETLVSTTRKTLAVLTELRDILDESQNESEYAGCETRCCEYCMYGD